jgi:outer membrane protein assembly factor BamE
MRIVILRKIILRLMLSIGLPIWIMGCIIKPYIPDVQQGNVMDQEQIASLMMGMSEDEVRELLGDPVLTNMFDRRCPVYAYTNQINGGKISSKYLRVCFDSEGHLINVLNNQDNQNSPNK